MELKPAIKPMAETDKTELLAGLKLDRSSTPAPSRSYGWMLVLVPLIGLGAWWFGASAPEIIEPATYAQEPLLDAVPMPREVSTSALATAASLQASGYVVARQAATVSARTTAVVQQVFVEEGDVVAAGALLAQLNDSVKRAELHLAMAEHEGAQTMVREVETQLEAAERRLNRINALARQSMASEAELDEVSTILRHLQARLASTRQAVATSARRVDVRRAELADYTIRAPFAGVVTSRTAQPGEIVSPISAGGGFTRTGIATLVDMASLEVEVDVNESYISRVDPDGEVAVILNAYPDQPYRGRVLAVIPNADRSKGTIRVRIRMLDRDQRILPEMAVRVDFLDT